MAAWIGATLLPLLRRPLAHPIDAAARAAPRLRSPATMTEACLIAAKSTTPARAARATVDVRRARSQPTPSVDHRPADHVRRHRHAASGPVANGIMARVRAQARQRAAREKRRTSRRAILRP